ncbi:MAG: hypothetical protein COW03_09805 [Cytophagales bacterium CG12_big_fil_rev_8_21_14_0_65_40_12]|nr:MAG: hypothetical protein COW03_09805 [Cytophagales bacterium CG12_big_fil_rev_8_21_14_0_65_40_12]PIW04623.1 MAG: DUF2147 domain-containing protein [Cytophagales bacterium CG17_big_fil_post_rev_8_21_14_2_50_40_13]
MKLIISLLFISVLSLTPNTNDGDAILGTWLTDENKAKIEIYKEKGLYHGRIIWLKEPLNEKGQPKVDKHNHDKTKRARPILGMNLIQGFKFSDGKWEDGEIYDPENGKTYSCVIKLKGNKLEVRGYVGMTMFGRTVTWVRAEVTD